MNQQPTAIQKALEILNCEKGELRAEVERLTMLHANAKHWEAHWLFEIERLTAAIRTTASQGTYDEMAIRKAVSFELAELIAEVRAALEPKP